jgi:hypothetical protein
MRCGRFCTEGIVTVIKHAGDQVVGERNPQIWSIKMLEKNSKNYLEKLSV